MDGVKYMTVSERGGAAIVFDIWFNAVDYIDYILNNTDEISMILFELVDGKICNGMRYYKDGKSEVVI